MPEMMIVLPTLMAGKSTGTSRVRVAVDPLPVPSVGTSEVPDVALVLVSATMKSCTRAFIMGVGSAGTTIARSCSCGTS
jgi:hypothetical protein